MNNIVIWKERGVKMRKYILYLSIALVCIFSSYSINAEEKKEVRKNYKNMSIILYFKKVDGKWFNYKNVEIRKTSKKVENYLYGNNKRDCVDTGDELVEHNCVFYNGDRDDTGFPMFTSFTSYYKYNNKYFPVNKYKFERYSKNYLKKVKIWNYNKKNGRKTTYYEANLHKKGYLNFKTESSNVYYENGKRKWQFKRSTNWKKYGISYMRTNYKNGKKKELLYFSDHNKKSKYEEISTYKKYSVKGVIKVHKKSYINKDYNPKKMIIYMYNKKGTKFSNKSGNAYKYIVTFKSKSNEIGKYKAKKVVRAKYDNLGKLGKYKKVKLTKFNTKAYSWNDTGYESYFNKVGFIDDLDGEYLF